MSKRGEIKQRIVDLKRSGYGKSEVMAQIDELEKELVNYPPQKVAKEKEASPDQSAADDLLDHWNDQY